MILVLLLTVLLKERGFSKAIEGFKRQGDRQSLKGNVMML
jgi:hypothetical protein